MTSRKLNNFSMMVAGYTGTGKSSFVNTLFNNHIIEISSKNDDEINIYTMEIPINETIRKTNVVYVPSFGLKLNDKETIENINIFIKAQFHEFLKEETKIQRNSKFEDCRIHVLFYFIAPNINGMNSLDIEFLKSVHEYINIIPVIGKSDILSNKEISMMRTRFNEQIKEHNISIFNFSDDFSVLKSEVMSQIKELNTKEGKSFDFSDILPLKIVSKCWIDTEQDRSHGETVIDHESLLISDFTLVKEIVLGKTSEILIENTNDDLYEKYRTLTLTMLLPNTKNDLNTVIEQKNLNEIF